MKLADYLKVWPPGLSSSYGKGAGARQVTFAYRVVVYKFRWLRNSPILGTGLPTSFSLLIEEIPLIFPLDRRLEQISYITTCGCYDLSCFDHES